ncbi:MAG: ParB/RepB/Spo0J family partition protein [Candidatus Aminicenantaceae bacterium]
MKSKKLSLKKINLKDERYRISYFFSLEKMISSLKKMGLINPPLVAFRDNRFIIVSGWKRVLACRKLSYSSIQVRVSDAESDLQNFLIALYENLPTKSFSLVEKAEIVLRLKKFGMKESRIIEDYFSPLDIPPRSTYLDGFLALSQFEPELKEGIHRNNMPFSSIQRLSEYTPKTRSLIFPLLLPLSQNKQREVLEDIQDISERENIPVEDVLKKKEIRNILDLEKLSLLQKAGKIRLFLRKKRYPLLSSWEESFKTSLKKMKWPKEIEIRHSPFFEGENISVTFSFRNRKEFEENLLKLKGMASNKEFPRLLK